MNGPHSIGTEAHAAVLRASAALLLAALTFPATCFAAESDQLEYRVKAAFLYNFARFVSWPPEVERASEWVVIGVLGSDPFGPLLEGTVSGKTVSGKPFRLRRIATLEEARECHLLFVAASERRRLDEVLAALRGMPVLTVGETDGFFDRGGMIQFVIEQEAVRIDINLDAARHAGLEISSQLLRVARSVRRAESQ